MKRRFCSTGSRYREMEITMNTVILIVIAFIVWFGAVWTSVLTLLSLIGGWRKLSLTYPASLSAVTRDGERFPYVSARFGFINYRSCVSITFTETGILFTVMKLFSIMHSPIHIPYSKISGIEKGKLFLTYTGFSVDGKKILLYGEAGERLYDIRSRAAH